MAKSLDKVLQADGTYKWEEVELKHSTASVEACPCLLYTSDAADE